ncbi:MAG: hypothetical protein LBH72_06735 [Proteiniphilum sp.]|jgi:opacity protein-like surface antigen|nr:hypothetical protein [Proteiniphilum sp.]
MRRVFTLGFFFSLLLVPEAHAQFEGTVGAGIHAAFGGEVNSLGGGLHAHYYYTNNLRFSPSVTHFPERKGDAMWITDADAHYIFPISIAASLYPVAGLHYSLWKRYDAKRGDTLVEGWRKHRLGINLGVGLQHDIAYKVCANFELKYQIIPGHPQVIFTAGLGFWF